MKELYCKKGNYYFIRLHAGYIKVRYEGIKDRKRYFTNQQFKRQYILSKDEVNRLVSAIPRQEVIRKRFRGKKT